MSNCACNYRPPLCAECRQRAYDWLSGVAMARGAWWAEDIVRALVARGRAFESWPAFNERARAIALRRIDDLAEDEELAGMLARACAEAAARRYTELVGDETARVKVLNDARG